MKKHIIGILLLVILFFPNITHSNDYPLNKIPDNFKPWCFEYYQKIDKNELFNKKEQRKTYKIKINKNNLVFTQKGFILPYKYYADTQNSYKYNSNISLNNKYLSDYNRDTYEEINSNTQNEIILNFDEVLEKNNFNFNLSYTSNNFIPKYYISNDKEDWKQIKKESIEDFSFKYLKIIFKLRIKEKITEKIKIYELSFSKKSDTYLLKILFNEDLEIYSKFNCKNKDFSTRSLYHKDYIIDKDTKILEINMQNNPKYNVYKKSDYDNDWVEDSLDNCKTKYNPNQKDSDGNGVGDVCSDVDRDGITGYYDNCPYISNRSQKDININGVGDACEFDKDKDSVFDSIDNCLSQPNSDQKDKDHDGIGDLCDNCKYYNPTQIDKDGNNVGDLCDAKIKDLEENDKDKDEIHDSIDNCKDVSNKDQLDTDRDGVGDVCDNCLSVKNTDQKDKNDNKIGDLCEDSDGDGVIGYLDNCIDIANNKQEDDDNNGVGNLCEDKDNDKILFANDNCPFDYNPDQEDIDKDKLGDKCDKKDDRFIESNKRFFVGLLIFIAILFGGGIFYMMRRINK